MSLIPRENVTDFDRLLDGFFAPSRSRGEAGESFFSPHVDIEDHDDHYLIKAELPGVKKENIEVSLHDGMLTLQAEHREESEKKEKGKVIRSERRIGKFSRSFSVPRTLKAEDINGAMDDGILTITVPKAPEEESPTSRSVKIN